MIEALGLVKTYTYHFNYEKALCALNLISPFLLLSLGGLLVPEGIIRPVVSVPTLAWFIRYICYSNLQFLNNVIIITTKDLLPRA